MKNKTLVSSTLLICFVLIVASELRAQSTDSLINEAFANNPYINSLKYQIKASEHRASSYDALPPPVVGFEVSDMPFSSVNLIDDPLYQTLSFSQMFPLGGKIEAMKNVGNSNINVSRDLLEIYKVNLSGSIKMSYYNIWLIEKKIEIQKESIDLLNQLLASITKLYEINRISQADIFTLKSEIANNETQLLILNNQKESEIYKLNKLLGRDLNSKEVSVSKELPSSQFIYSQEELASLLASRNPSLKKMNSMIDMNKLDVIANNKEKIPDLMLQAMIMRMPRGMIVTTKTPPDMIMGNGTVEYGYGLMASVTLPFVPWASGKFSAKELEIQSNIQSIESEKQDMLRDMTSLLKNAYLKMKTSRDLMKLYSENVLPLYEKARSAQISSYQNNQANINTVIDANRMLLMQSMNYFMAQADYQMAVAEIEMMVGSRLN